MRSMIAILLLCVLPDSTLPAQTPDRNVTLAINGLNLRDAPDRNAKVLAKIPFKSTVEFISCDAKPVTLPDMYGGIMENVLTSHSLEGYWVKVRYQQHTGYVFSAFLASDYYLDQWYTYQHPALLGVEINGIWADFMYGAPAPDMEIYGAYDDKGYLAFEKIGLIIYADQEGYVSYALDLKRKYLLAFTTGHPLPVGIPRRKIVREVIPLQPENNAETRLNALLATAGLHRLAPNHISTSSDSDPVYRLDGDCPSTGIQSDQMRLFWYGDLDGDGKNDYFYHLENSVQLTTLACLYLSSELSRFSNEFCYYYGLDTPYYVTPGNYYTIARSGLNMREGPAPDDKVILKIPYGERVKVLEEWQPGLDTLRIGGIRYYGNYDTGTPENNYADTVYIAGARTRISYKGKTGYVHSSYLCDFPQSAPVGNYFYMSLFHSRYYYDPDWHYYGLYWENDRYDLRKITPSIFSSTFFSEIAEGYVLSLSVLGNEYPIYPAYVFGAKMPLQEGYKGIPLPEEVRGDLSEADDALLNTLRLDWEGGENSDGVRRVFAVRRNGLRQEIAFKKPYIQDELFHGTLEWYGDLDGDGEWDYIFSFFNECGTDDFLYMSTEGGQGKLLRPSYRQIVPCGC